MIPLGQPILGHHSEKSHRRHLKRIDQHFAKAQDHHNKAEHYRRRVAALESNRVIFSDDPDATEKLVDKIERLKKRQGTMKRANSRSLPSRGPGRKTRSGRSARSDPGGDNMSSHLPVSMSAFGR
jgi:hypothetical protein